MNQLTKVANGLDSTNLASQKSGSDTNTQNEVALPSNLCLVPTILFGGVGFRLWWVSLELHPKSFIRLANRQSLLQRACLRGALLPGVSHLMTVTNRGLSFKIEDELRGVNVCQTSASYILEPFTRNTAPAIAAAAFRVVQTHGQEAIQPVLAADHLIADQFAFQQAVLEAVDLEKEGKLVTFGIQPSAPETGYGYMKAKATESCDLWKSLPSTRPKSTWPLDGFIGVPACSALRRVPC